MIRGPRHVSVACREPGGDEKGNPVTAPDTPIFTETELVSTFASRLTQRYRFMKWPLIRGVLVLLESMELGSKGLRLSARIAMTPPVSSDLSEETAHTNGALPPAVEEAPVTSVSGVPVALRVGGAALAGVLGAGLLYLARHQGWLSRDGLWVIVGVLILFAVLLSRVRREEAREGSLTLSGIAVGATMVLGLSIGVGFFFLLPSLLAGALHRYLTPWQLNLSEGVLRLVMFFGYLKLIARMPNIRRLFQYHGAEHQVIHAHEHDLELTPENAARFSTIHPRCGTAFLAIVLVVSVLVFTFAGWQVWWERLLVRLAGLPVIAGVSYELLKWNSRRPNRVLSAFAAPGLWFQKITTQPPDRDQVEVAIAAMQGVLAAESESV